MSMQLTHGQLSLVTFYHQEQDCPVWQTTPELALGLSQRLADARKELGAISGAFLPLDHRGAAVVFGSPNQVLRSFQKILIQPHHEVSVHSIAPSDARLATIAADPTCLEGPSDKAMTNRDALFSVAHEFEPQIGYNVSLKAKTPSMSLVELEDFLSTRAAEIAQAA